jgi:hypothetical protein
VVTVARSFRERTARTNVWKRRDHDHDQHPGSQRHGAASVTDSLDSIGSHTARAETSTALTTILNTTVTDEQVRRLAETAKAYSLALLWWGPERHRDGVETTELEHTVCQPALAVRNSGCGAKD